MELTTNFIKENFIVFNNRYFDGKLRMPRFEVIHSKSLLGQLNWDDTGGIITDYVIRVSDYFNRGEKGVQNTILHEMIHLYIRQNKLKDTRTHHGAIFYREADRINKDGWNISRTDSVKGYGIKDKKTFYLVAFKDSKGRYFLMSYNPKKEAYYLTKFTKYSWHYIDPVWFTSTDSKAYGHLTTCQSGVRCEYIPKASYDALQRKYSLPLAI